MPHGSFGAQPHVVQPQPILPGNLYRTMSPLSVMTSYRSRGELRAPTPQLQQLSMRPPYVASTSSPFIPASVPHGSFGAQPRAVQPEPILPVNLCRTMSPPSMMMSYRSTGPQLRAPAPHLKQLSTRPPYVATRANQQHLSDDSLVRNFQSPQGPSMDMVISSAESAMVVSVEVPLKFRIARSILSSFGAPNLFCGARQLLLPSVPPMSFIKRFFVTCNSPAFNIWSGE